MNTAIDVSTCDVPGAPLMTSTVKAAVELVSVPTAWHRVTDAQATVNRSPDPVTGAGAPGLPLVIGTTSPVVEPSPAATQVVAEAQAIPVSGLTPLMKVGAPGTPLVTLTNAPMVNALLGPTV